MFKSLYVAILAVFCLTTTNAFFIPISQAPTSWKSRPTFLACSPNAPPLDADFVQCRITIAGHTSGKYYVAQARNEATNFRKLTGKLSDSPGRCEMIVEGKKKQIEGFLRWCRKGAGLGGVAGSVDEEWGEATGVFSDFDIDSSI